MGLQTISHILQTFDHGVTVYSLTIHFHARRRGFGILDSESAFVPGVKLASTLSLPVPRNSC